VRSLSALFGSIPADLKIGTGKRSLKSWNTKIKE